MHERDRLQSEHVVHDHVQRRVELPGHPVRDRRLQRHLYRDGLVPRRDRLSRVVRVRRRLPGHSVSAAADLPVDLRVRKRLLVAGRPLQHLPVDQLAVFFWRLACLVFLRAAFLAFVFFFVDFALVDFAFDV